MNDETWAGIAEVCHLDDSERAELEPVFDTAFESSGPPDGPIAGVFVWRERDSRKVHVNEGAPAAPPYGFVRFLGEYASFPTLPVQGARTVQD